MSIGRFDGASRRLSVVSNEHPLRQPTDMGFAVPMYTRVYRFAKDYIGSETGITYASFCISFSILFSTVLHGDKKRKRTEKASMVVGFLQLIFRMIKNFEAGGEKERERFRFSVSPTRNFSHGNLTKLAFRDLTNFREKSRASKIQRHRCVWHS